MVDVFHKFETQPSLAGCLLNFYWPVFHKIVLGENNRTFYQKKNWFSTLLFNLSVIMIGIKNWKYNMNKRKFQSISAKKPDLFKQKLMRTKRRRELRYFSYLNSLFTLKNPLLAFKFVLRPETKEFFYGLSA